MINQLTIAGGGLAGLSLGRALAQRGIPVELHEAGTYPRHKVCGEFISGLTPETIRILDLEPLLTEAISLNSVRWFRRNQMLRDWNLPAPAQGISRFRLDAALAKAFVNAGGKLVEHSRISLSCEADKQDLEEGLIQATGRVPARGSLGRRWLGLKIHVLPPFALDADLEVHLGKNAYVGLSRIEDGRVNLCGLFQQRELPDGNRDSLLETYLEQAQLFQLRERLVAAQCDPKSRCAVAGLDFRQDTSRAGYLRLGDSRGMTPPYTGHGMAMALESAALALDPLVAYAQGKYNWGVTTGLIQQRHARLRRRLRCARFLHFMLHASPPQQWLGQLTRLRLLPLNQLYHLTRS